MSLESKLSSIGKALDRALVSLKKTIASMFLETAPHKRRHHPHKGQSGIASSQYAVLIFDSFVAFLSIFISIHLRIGMDFLDYSPAYIMKNMFVFGLVSSSVFLWLQTHQSFWRYTSVEDMMPIFLSVILSNLIFFPLMMLMNQEDFLPYSVLIINVFVLSVMLLTPRFLSRMMYNQRMNKMKKFDKLTQREEAQVDMPPVLLIGNNSSVEVFLREVVINEDVTFNFDPVGILSISDPDVGRTIKGVTILGEIRDLARVLRTLHEEGVFPRQIVITEKAIPDNIKNFLVRYVQEHGLLLMHVIHQYTFNTVVE